MLDLKFIRENVDLVRQAIVNKNEKADVDKLVKLDEQRRESLKAVEALKSQRNQASQEIASMKREGRDAQAAISEMQQVNAKIKELDEQVRVIHEQISELQSWIPNIPHETTPVGKDENSNVVVKSWGEPKKQDFKAKPHWEIAEELGLVRGRKALRFFLCELPWPGRKTGAGTDQFYARASYRKARLSRNFPSVCR
jgi:seryl-tRNA synthetase